MRNITLFVEDEAHEAVLGTLVKRLASEFHIVVEINFRSARGGFSRTLSKLREYIRDIKRGYEITPDLLVICTDGNCKGYTARKQEIEQEITEYGGAIIYAIPDPHIERWLLLDSTAFKNVLGRGCPAPPKKCERDLFKRKLLDAILGAGVRPLLGGIEHAEDIVNEMNLEYLEQADESLGRLLKALRDSFKVWI
ncbi:MAG TPA: hypothetical protein VEY11_02675 [Pyrinomonadaceae bacterium]|nr:hypothetical protein [Pyrinomonadaceae bacterium]